MSIAKECATFVVFWIFIGILSNELCKYEQARITGYNTIEVACPKRTTIHANDKCYTGELVCADNETTVTHEFRGDLDGGQGKVY